MLFKGSKYQESNFVRNICQIPYQMVYNKFLSTYSKKKLKRNFLENPF
jgi:hypothetical protein